jgi:hypothetical protein
MLRIAKCVRNSRKLFRCEVTFLFANTFCSWAHHIFICSWPEQRPNNRGDLESSVTGEVRRVTRAWTVFWFHFCILHLVSNTAWMLGYFLNGTTSMYLGIGIVRVHVYILPLTFEPVDILCWRTSTHQEVTWTLYLFDPLPQFITTRLRA